MKFAKSLMAAALLASAAAAAAKVNINTADADELRQLNHIGKKKAEAIVAYREANGSFSSVEELSRVKGVSAKMVAELAEDLTISEKTDLSDLKHHKRAKAEKPKHVPAKEKASGKADKKGAEAGGAGSSGKAEASKKDKGAQAGKGADAKDNGQAQ